jgi:hypothetical protein
MAGVISRCAIRPETRRHKAVAILSAGADSSPVGSAVERQENTPPATTHGAAMRCAGVGDSATFNPHHHHHHMFDNRKYDGHKRLSDSHGI